MTGTLIVAASCLAGAGALLLLSPVLLRLRPWQVRHPRRALLSWFGVFTAGVVAAVVALAVVVAGSVLPGADRHGATLAVAVAAAGWLGLGAVGVAIGLAAAAAEPMAGAGRDAARAIGRGAVARENHGRFVLVRVDDRMPVACAVPGAAAPEIMVTTGMERLLSRPQLQAVLAHEYAHLRHRHGWLLLAAQVNAACLPGMLRAGRDLRQSTRLLVELAADDTAARQAGPAHLANALTRLAGATADPSMEYRAQRLAQRSWPSPARRRVPAPVRL